MSDILRKPFLQCDSLPIKVEKLIIHVKDLEDIQDDQNEKIDAIVEDNEVINNKINDLYDKVTNYEVISFKILASDWSNDNSYTFSDSRLLVDNVIEVYPTADGTVVDGVTVVGNMVNCGQAYLQALHQETDGQIIFNVQNTPSETLYVTLLVLSRGDNYGDQ